jgi:hypothetical protein
MIQINLLPPERRRIERTPIGRFLLILIGVVVACVQLSYIAWILFIEIPNNTNSRNNKQESLVSESTRLIEREHVELTARKKAHEDRVKTVDLLKPPFRWSDIVDVLCDELQREHKKIWLDELRVMKMGELRTRQTALGTNEQFESGLYIKAQSAGADPDPLLKLRRDFAQKPAIKPSPVSAGGASPTGTPGVARVSPRKYLIEYFTGGLIRIVEFRVEKHDQFEEKAAQAFALEFYVRQGAAKK